MLKYVRNLNLKRFCTKDDRKLKIRYTTLSPSELMIYQAKLKPIITNEDQDILVYYSRVPV